MLQTQREAKRSMSLHCQLCNGSAKAQFTIVGSLFDSIVMLGAELCPAYVVASYIMTLGLFNRKLVFGD